MKKLHLYGRQMKSKEADQPLMKKLDGGWLLLRTVYGMLYLKYVLVLIKLFKIIVGKDYQLIFLQLYLDPGWGETEMVTQMSHQILLILSLIHI